MYFDQTSALRGAFHTKRPEVQSVSSERSGLKFELIGGLKRATKNRFNILSIECHQVAHWTTAAAMTC